MTFPTVHIAKEEAAEAATNAAFHITDTESSEYGRKIIHCFIGFIGADWNLEAVLEDLNKADEITWTDHWMGHDLTIRVDNQVHHFGVTRPEKRK